MTKRDELITVDFAVTITADPVMLRPHDREFLYSITPHEERQLVQEVKRVLGPALLRLADERLVR